MFITLSFISFTRIFFRSDSLQIVITIFERISNHFGADLSLNVLEVYYKVIGLMIFGYLIHWIPEKLKENYRQWFARQAYWAMGFITIVLVFILYQLMSGENAAIHLFSILKNQFFLLNKLGISLNLSITHLKVSK